MIDAIEQACSAEGDFRVRLGSMEPEMISDEDIARMKALPKLCPQFHLSLQSGCDKTLKAMNRHYNSAEYLAICDKLRKAFPNCAITTDIMVGFPQETDEDFRQSLEFAKKVGFASAHIFPYSRRSGTVADKFGGQLDKKTKSRRSAEMTEVCRKTQLEYNRSFIGKTVDVLFERESSAEFHQGHIPEYVLVKVPRNGTESLRKEVRKVRITAAETDYCLGELISEK
jgi:threonylcarbamoyladenosine tRNA methylthiotransferase MtaB